MIGYLRGDVVTLGPLLSKVDSDPVKATILAVGKTTYDVELRYKGVLLKKATLPKTALEEL